MVESFEEPVEDLLSTDLSLWFLLGLTWIIPQHVWSSVSDPSTFTNNKPVGSGAFTLKTFSTQSYLFAANAAYWKESNKPAIGGLRYVSYSGNTAATSALVAGQLDWADVFIPDVQKAFVSRDTKNNHIALAPSDLVTYLMPNLTTFPTNDVAVRKAISYALDRSTINKQAESGYFLDPSPVLTLSPRDNSYVRQQYLTPIKFDTNKAKQTLTDAGYKQGSDGIFADSQGRKVKITCLVVTGYTDYISSLQLIGENLKSAGIGFTSQEISLAAFGANRAQGKFQMLIDAAAGGPGPYYLFNNLLNSSLSAPIGQIAVSNFVRYKNDKVDALLDQMASTNDQDKIKQAAYGIEDIVFNDVPYIPLLQRTDLSEFRTTKVTGFPAATGSFSHPGVSTTPGSAITAVHLKPAS